MKNANIRISEEARDCLNEFTKQYEQKSVSDFIIYLSRYLDRNDIDLNFDVKNDVYNTLKLNQKKFDKFSDNLFKNEERIIKILRRFELDYFKQITEINDPIVKEPIEVSINNYNSDLFNDLVSKINIEESDVTGRKKYVVNISDDEYQKLKNNAR